MQDQKIGGAVRLIGHIGMLASVSWLAWRVMQSAKAKPKPLSW